MSRTGQAWHNVSDTLLVTCWCGAKLSFVSAEKVRQGETWSCGPLCRPGCPVDEPDYSLDRRMKTPRLKPDGFTSPSLLADPWRIRNQWTPKMDEDLLLYVREEVSWTTIAKQLQRPMAVCRGRADMLRRVLPELGR